MQNLSVDEVLDIIEKLKKEDLNDSKINFEIGLHYSTIGRYDESIKFYEKSIDLGKTDYEVYSKIGIAYYYTVNYPMAKKFLGIAKELKSDDTMVNGLYGSLDMLIPASQVTNELKESLTTNAEEIEELADEEFEPFKPATVPSNAIWNESENEWELGKYNELGKNIGEWKWWLAPNGHLVCHTLFDDEGEMLEAKRFHPNGEISLDLKCGENGYTRYYKSTEKTTENFPFTKDKNAFEARFIGNKYVFFDKLGNELKESLNEPKKPTIVPEEAIWKEELKCWEMGSYDDKGLPIGLWSIYRAPKGYLYAEMYFNELNEKIIDKIYFGDGKIAIDIDYKEGSEIYYMHPKARNWDFYTDPEQENEHFPKTEFSNAFKAVLIKGTSPKEFLFYDLDNNLIEGNLIELNNYEVNTITEAIEKFEKNIYYDEEYEFDCEVTYNKPKTILENLKNKLNLSKKIPSELNNFYANEANGLNIDGDCGLQYGFEILKNSEIMGIKDFYNYWWIDLNGMGDDEHYSYWNYDDEDKQIIEQMNKEFFVFAYTKSEEESHCFCFDLEENYYYFNFHQDDHLCDLINEIVNEKNNTKKSKNLVKLIDEFLYKQACNLYE